MFHWAVRILGIYLVSLCLSLGAATAPAITTQPSNKAVTLGSTATFTVVASGTGPLTYQWSRSSSAISGATSASYVTPATLATDNGAIFTVTVTNSAGSATSNPATLTVNLPPTISTQPADQTVLVGATATFSVVASGTGTLTYQWYKSGSTISGATAASYTTPATTAAYNGVTYTVKVTNSYGNLTSSAATLTVNSPAAITTQPTNQAVTLGATATFTVVASGTSPLTYQWSRNSSVISGATSASYTTPVTVATDSGSTFSVQVTNPYGNVTSSSVTLTVNLPPAISTQPASVTVLQGATATFSVVASGTATLTYQWSKNGTTISGATATSYTTPATTAAYNGVTYTVKVTNTYGNITSSVATLTVNMPPTITTQPASTSVALGATATFTVVASGTAPLTFQWSKSGTAINGATSASYTTPATVTTDTGSTYKVVITNSFGNITSSSATLTVQIPPSITTQPVNKTVNLGATANFSVVAAGTAPLTYQWSKNGVAVSGAVAASYTTPVTVASDTGAVFTVQVTNAFGVVTSSPVTLTLNLPPTISTQPLSQTVNVGTTVSFNVVATGTGTLTYQWSKNGTSITGAKSASYTTLATTVSDNGSSYTVKVTNTYGNVTSAGAIVTIVVPPPSQPVITAPAFVTANQPGYLASVPSQAASTYDWGINGGTYPDGSSSNQVTFTPLGMAMPVALVHHTATLLPDGRVLITGGNTTGGYQSASAYLYQPATANFINVTANMNNCRYGHTATLLPSGKVLLAGGTYINSAEIFDPVTGSFSPIAGVTATSRFYHTATLLPSGKVLIAGGDSNGGATLSSAELFDPNNEIFTTLPAQMNNGRVEHTATVLGDGTVLFAGGSNNSPSISSAEIFNPSTAAFSLLETHLVRSRRSHTATLLVSGEVLLAGGLDEGWTALNSAERYNPSTRVFTSTSSPLATGREHHSATLLSNGMVFLVGGDNYSGGYWADGELYNPSSDAFTTVSGTMNFARSSHTASLLSNGQILLAGGTDDQGNPIATMDLYDEGTSTFVADSALDLSCTVTNASGIQSTPGTLQIRVVAPMVQPVITGPSIIWANKSGYSASVKAQIGCTYTWVVTNGTITDGGGTATVTFTGGNEGTPLTLGCTATNPAGSVRSASIVTIPVIPGFVTISPSNVVLAPGGQQVFTANQPVTWYTKGLYYAYVFPSGDGTSATFIASWYYGGDLKVGSYLLGASSIADSTIVSETNITVYTPGSPIINQFTANPAIVHAGQLVTLNWDVSNATEVWIDNGPDLSGTSVVVDPEIDYSVSSKTYRLYAKNGLGVVWREINVQIDMVPTAYLITTSTVVPAGDTVQLIPTFTNGNGVINPGGISVQSGVPVTVHIQGTTLYTLTVANGYGASATSKLLVNPGGRGAFLPSFSLPQPLLEPSIMKLRDGNLLIGGLESILSPDAYSWWIFDQNIGTFNKISLINRYSYCSPLLCSDGRVLFCMGTSSNGTDYQLVNFKTNKVIHIYIPGNWNFRYDSVSTVLLADGRVFLVGQNGDFESGSVLITLPGSNTDYYQIKMTNTPLTVKGGRAVIRLMDGRILAAGGSYWDYVNEKFIYYTSSEIYDPNTELWSPAANLQNGANIQNVLLMHDGRVNFNGKEIYDPSNNTVSQLSPPFVGFEGFGTGALQLQSGRIILGNEDPNPLFYDPVSIQCSTISGISNWNLAGEMYMGYHIDGSIFTGGLTWTTYYDGSRGNPRLTKLDHIDPQDRLVIFPTGGETNVGLPLTFIASGPDAQGVIWSSSSGSISSDGHFVSQKAGWVSVTATAQNGTQSKVWVDVHPAVAVSINSLFIPNAAKNIHAGLSYQFTANVWNHPIVDVIWGLQEGPTAGVISSTGVYSPINAGTYHIVATSVADPNQSGYFQITVLPPISLSISPTSITIESWGQVEFTTQEPTGDNWANWSTNGVNLGGDDFLHYVAPAISGVYTLTAVSVVDPTKSATATITVVPMTSFYISPSRIILALNGTINLRAYTQSLAGTKDISSSVVWSTTGGLVLGEPSGIAGGTVGYYTAPNIPGTYTVQAIINGSTVSAEATIIVVPPTSFNTSGQMTINREGHCMTRLLDGRILITGGYNVTAGWDLKTTSNSAELYDPDTKAFTVLSAGMTVPRVDHSATLLPNGKVLIIGGSAQANAELFDPSSSSFIATATPPGYSRDHHFSFLLPDGHVLIAGGNDQFSGKSMEIYDSALDAFCQIEFLNTPNNTMDGAAILLADGRVLFAGGSSMVNAHPLTVVSQSNAEVFDFRTGLSSLTGALAVPQVSFNLTQTANGKVWLIGQTVQCRQEWDGYNYEHMPAAESFDSIQNTFVQGPLQLNAGGDASTPLVDGSIWSMGPLAVQFGAPARVYGMRFNPNESVFEESIIPSQAEGVIGNDVKTILLPTGDVLWTGLLNRSFRGAGNAPSDAGLLLFDNTPALTVLPQSATLLAGCSWPFQASATGLGNAGFNWSVNGGSVTDQGVYTAPITPGLYHVTGTSKANATVQATAVVTVVQGTELVVTPGLVQLAPLATQVFRVDMINTGDRAVTWNSSGGTIGTDGTYTAPSTPGAYTVTATSIADPSRSATATIIVNSSGGGLPKPYFTAFFSDTPLVLVGHPANLTWNVTGAYQLALYANGVSQEVTGRSGISVYPSAATTYYLTARNPSGTVTSQTITINATNTPVSISITPTTATIYAGQSMNFGWSLSAPTNQMIWTCSAGSINQTGVYTAPTQPGTYTVTVTSVDDPRQSATASVTVIPQVIVPVSVQISPLTLDIYPSRTTVLGTSVSAPSGSSTDVTWTTTAGSIVSLDRNTGYFTAPDAAGTCTVTATSVADPTKSSSCTVTVKMLGVTLSISPATVELGSGECFKFGSSIQVAGSTDSSLTWRTEAGTILSSGDGSALYKAPLEAGTYRVSAISNANPKVFATAMVTVNPARSFLVIAPSEVRLSIGGTQSFSAQGSISSGPVQWSIVESGGGTIDANGLYTAPATRGIYTVVAVASTSVGFMYATAQVTVGSLVIQAPSQLTLFPGDSYAFAASQQSGSSYALIWSIDEGLLGGAITPDGVYTAPQQAGYYHVRVSDSEGLSDVKEVLVTLINAIGISPKVEILEEGDYVLSASLLASNGKRIRRSASLHLGVGMQESELTFGADRLKTDLGVDGPYQVVDVRIEKSMPDDVVPADSPQDLGVTAAYRLADLERPWITAGGLVTADALDLNGNGLADQLRVYFDVTLVAMGNYTWSGALVDGDGLVIGHAYGGPSLLSSGSTRLPLIFSGTAIRVHGKDGPYYLRNLLLHGPVLRGSGDWSGAIIGYQANQFEVPLPPPATAAGSAMHAALSPPQKDAAKQTTKKGVKP